MLIKIGRLCIAFGKIVIVKDNLIVVERDIVVRVPRVVEVEEVWQVPSPRIERVPQVVEIPEFSVRTIDHQLIQHNYVVAEKPYPIRVVRPVVEEVAKTVTVQKLTFEEKEVPVPHYSVVPGEDIAVKAPRRAVFAITCACGNTYTTNHTKCHQCGRTTADNLKET